MAIRVLGFYLEFPPDASDVGSYLFKSIAVNRTLHGSSTASQFTRFDREEVLTSPPKVSLREIFAHIEQGTTVLYCDFI
jgi:hypothetical protein